MTDSYTRRLLSEREQITLVTRQHWLVLVQAILPESILIIGIILMVVLSMVLLQGPMAFLWGLILLLLPIVSMVRDIVIYINHRYIVTNRRVIQIFGVINKNVTDSSLEKVNDVKLDQSFLGRIFNYGDVEILTASELGTNLFAMIEDPIKFKTAMMNAKIALNSGEDINPTAKSNVDIPGMIAKLDELRQKGILTEEEFQKKKAELLAKL
jgi:uncharacterized membrane protein YdbT with pleckstrin-like domain